MDHFEVTKTPEGFHIEGPKAQRLASLGLHNSDLEFALNCLEQINNVPEQPYVLRQALWRSAVVHYMKCFGNSRSRFSLAQKKVYKGDAGAMEAHEYFDSLRNKHLVHDENSYAQCLPGAVLNKKDMDHKIAKIVGTSFTSDTLNQASYSNLHQLITQAQEWVIEQFDQLCNVLTTELELEPYEALFARQGITYSKPEVDDIHRPRKAL